MKTSTQKLFALMILLYLFISADSHATKWIINVQNFSFSPASLPSVFVGDTLRWVWISGSHTTTNTIIPPSAPTWDNPINVSNQFFEYVPSIVGIYNYKCTPHAGMGMVGSFIVSPLPFISLNLKVFLEGPFNGTGMNTDINTTGLIPLAQPYNDVPWNYTGTENVPSIPNANIVDWVLVELRDAASAPLATVGTRIARQAGFVLKNGQIVGLNGSSPLQFNVTVTNQLFAIVWYKNHLGVMSSVGLTNVGGTYTYDFTTSAAQVYGGDPGHKQIGSGIWGMMSGDGDGNGTVNTTDKIPVWSTNSGKTGYFASDFNLDRQTNNKDKNEKWYPNLNKVSLVP